MINSQRRLFGRLTISFKICVMLYRTAVLKEISSHFSWLLTEWQGQLLAPSQLCLHWGSPKIGAGAALSPIGFPKDRCWGCCSLRYTGPHWGQSSTHMVFQTSAIQMTPCCSWGFSLMSLQSLTRPQTVSQTHPHGSKTPTSNLALVKQSSRFS